MWLRNIVKSLTATSTGQPARRSPRVTRPGVELLEGRWVPSFSPAVSYPIDIGPQTVVAADFNGDGRPDLASANRQLNAISVVLGNGDGTFQPPRTSTCGAPASIQAADLNADGRADLVILDRFTFEYGENNNTLRVLLGNGDGTFRPPQAITVGDQIPPSNPELGPQPQLLSAVAIGDFSGDGQVDLVIGGYTEWTTVLWTNEDGTPVYEYHDDCFANVLLGTGDGTFHLAGVQSTPSSVSRDAGDFDNDGRLDLLTAGGVLPGNGDGTFRDPVPSTYSPIVWSGSSDSVGDFNGDGNLDVLSSTHLYGANEPAVIRFGNGDGTFRPGMDFRGEGLIVTGVGDVNADGKLDVVVIQRELDYDAFTTTSSLQVLLGNADGSFAAIVDDLGTLPGISYTTSAVLADFDGDGRPDLATTDDYVPYDGAPATSRGFVAHNDGNWTVLPYVTIGDATVLEGNTGTRAATFTVTLSKPWDQPVTVAYATADDTATAGSDYQAASGTLTIPAGQTSGTITVPVSGDRVGEGTESFVVNLSAPTNATIADGQGIGTILDDEPRISITDATVTEGNTGTRPITFTVTLSAAYDQNVTVSYFTGSNTADAGSDFVATSGTVTFAPGQTSKTIIVQVIGDRLAEANEAFFVYLGASTNATVANAPGVGTIIDDEPRISISDVTKAEGKKGQTTLFTFTVTLSAAYDQPVTMSFKTWDDTARTNDQDYVARSGTLTFAPGETTKTITIEVKGDSKRESTEYFYLGLYRNSSNSLFTKSNGLGTILNDD